MKRGIIGFALLVALLAGGWLSSRRLTAIHQPMGKLLDYAADCAEREDWNLALSLADRAEREWEANWRFTAAFADHDPMEQIDGLFAQLRVYANAGDRTAYAALCAELAREITAMGDAHAPNWWNLL